MTLAQRLIKQGKEQGKEEGIKEGEQKGKLEGKLETAKILLRKGIDIKVILEATGLPFELVGQLQGI